MNILKLKEEIKDLPDDMEVLMADYMPVLSILVVTDENLAFISDDNLELDET